MVAIPTIPTTSPESHTMVTTLSSMKAIHTIFKDQAQFYAKFGEIIVSAPFKMVDSDSFQKDLFSRDEKSALIINQVKAIHELSAGNIKIYEEKIRDKEFNETVEMYYTVHPDGAMSANGFPVAESFVLHPENKQRQRIMFLFSLYDFCKKVHQITSDFLPDAQETKLTVSQGAALTGIKPALSHDQIALIHIYKGRTITRDNGQEIAIKHGWMAKNSGESLYQSFSKYSKTSTRSGVPKSPTAITIQNKIILFESILPYLNENEQARLNKEINPLKIKLVTEDY